MSLIEGGQAIHGIAQKCTFKINARSDSQEALEELNCQMIKAFEQGAKLENERWGKTDIVKVTYEKLLNIPAGNQDDNCRIIQAAKLVTEAIGIKPTFMPGGSTNANIAIGKGIPAVCFGRGGEEYGQHTLDEWFNPEGVEACEQKSILMLLTLAGSFQRIKMPKVLRILGIFFIKRTCWRVTMASFRNKGKGSFSSRFSHWSEYVFLTLLNSTDAKYSQFFHYCPH